MLPCTIVSGEIVSGHSLRNDCGGGSVSVTSPRSPISAPTTPASVSIVIRFGAITFMKAKRAAQRVPFAQKSAREPSALK